MFLIEPILLTLTLECYIIGEKSMAGEQSLRYTAYYSSIG